MLYENKLLLLCGAEFVAEGGLKHVCSPNMTLRFLIFFISRLNGAAESLIYLPSRHFFIFFSGEIRRIGNGEKIPVTDREGILEEKI